MDRIGRRGFLRSAFVTATVTATGVRARRAWGQTGKPHAGTKLKMSQVSHAYGEGLVSKLPEFEQKTGIRVGIDQMSFPVLNQREDLELASGLVDHLTRD